MRKNPVIEILRDGYDSSDPWGSAIHAIMALEDNDAGPATPETVQDGLHSYTHGELTELRQAAGWRVIDADMSDPTSFPAWDYTPEQTPAEDELEQYEIQALRVMDRLADVAKANGLDY